jgi:hypothetical protein
MMDVLGLGGWHLTWQDPAALLLALLGILLSLWLRTRLGASGGCGSCPKSAKAAPPSLIPASRLLRRYR